MLREEPLDRWYEPGNVIAVVDARMGEEMTEESRYLLASQIANAGCVILSKAQLAGEDEIRATIDIMNDIMKQFHCQRRFGGDVLAIDWEKLSERDFDRIMKCGYRIEDHIKYQVEQENGYKSLFYFYLHMDEQQIRDAVKDLFADPACGTIHRIKGFVRMDNGEWIQINAVRDKIEFAKRSSGQEAVIVIGEDLHKEAVDRYLVEHAVYHGELCGPVSGRTCRVSRRTVNSFKPFLYCKRGNSKAAPGCFTVSSFFISISAYSIFIRAERILSIIVSHLSMRYAS